MRQKFYSLDCQGGGGNFTPLTAKEEVEILLPEKTEGEILLPSHCRGGVGGGVAHQYYSTLPQRWVASAIRFPNRKAVR